MMLIIIVIVISLSATQNVSAQDTSSEARTLAKQAIAISDTAAGDSQKLAHAIELFEQAFALDPRPQYQCSIGISYQESGNLALAHLYLGRCIARTSDAKRKSKLSAYHAAVEGELRKKGFVSVDLSSRPEGAELSIAALQGGKSIRTPILVWLGKGEHVVRATMAGHEASETTIVVAGRDIVQNIELLRVKTPAETGGDEQGMVEPDIAVRTGVGNDAIGNGDVGNDRIGDVAIVSGAAPSGGQSNSKRPTSTLRAWSAIGVSVVAAGGSAWLFTQALGARDEIREMNATGDAYDDLHSEVRTKEVLSYGLGVVALAGAVLGTYWLLESDEESQLDVALSEYGQGAVVSWSFYR